MKLRLHIPNKVTAQQGRAGILGIPADWEKGEK